MKADPKLIKAVIAALQPVVTLHEVSKVYRRLAKRWKYKKLRCWFNKSADKSGDWRWCLEGMLAKWGATVTLAFGQAEIDSKAPWEVFLADQMARSEAIRDLLKAAYDLAEDTENNTAASKLCDAQEDCECVIATLEAFARQIQDQGIQNWLAEMK